ncbi:MAG: cytochrome c oxidase assembly protein [Alphaproteobacteria bacterium]
MIPSDKARANKRVAMIATGVFVVMVGLTFAAVPLYSMFCKATAMAARRNRWRKHRRWCWRAPSMSGSTPTWRPARRSNSRPARAKKPSALGETSLMFFRITNPSDKPVTAVATYNVVPEQTGLFFKKLECFCFQQRTFAPGETIELPVVFFVDPALAQHPDTKDVGEITLSYTYFDAGDREVKTATAQAPKEIGRVVATP